MSLTTDRLDQTETFFALHGALTAEQWYQHDEAEAEARAEAAAERYFEEGTWQQREQYRWEVEQDERRAAFWAGAF